MKARRWELQSGFSVSSVPGEGGTGERPVTHRKQKRHGLIHSRPAFCLVLFVCYPTPSSTDKVFFFPPTLAVRVLLTSELRWICIHGVV